MTAASKLAPGSISFKSISSKTMCDFNFHLDAAFCISVSWAFDLLCSYLPLFLFSFLCSHPLVSDLYTLCEAPSYSFHLHPIAFTLTLLTVNTARPELLPCLYLIRLSILPYFDWFLSLSGLHGLLFQPYCHQHTHFHQPFDGLLYNPCK